jgi:hypothetical protein
MTYIQNTHLFRGFKLTFVDWFIFSLIEELTYEIDVWFQEKFLTNDALDLIGRAYFICLVWPLFQGISSSSSASAVKKYY